MIDYTEVPHTDDTWELFARDFLVARGFQVESQPDRGADGGKDILVTELLSGKLNKYAFRWLVSCKHFAHSNRSVGVEEEPSILERLGAFNADGFIGFYSTLPSAALNTRLRQLRSEGRLRDYNFIDGRGIERDLITVGYSELMLRFFPKSYEAVKPLHFITSKYEPVHCAICHKDLLLHLTSHAEKANVVYLTNKDEVIQDVVCVCKSDCDSKLQQAAKSKGLDAGGWTDMSDLVIPIEFLRFVFATMNRIRAGNDKYTDSAYTAEKHLLISIAQKVLRNTTGEERERFDQLSQLPF